MAGKTAKRTKRKAAKKKTQQKDRMVFRSGSGMETCFNKLRRKTGASAAQLCEGYKGVSGCWVTVRQLADRSGMIGVKVQRERLKHYYLRTQAELRELLASLPQETKCETYNNTVTPTKKAA